MKKIIFTFFVSIFFVSVITAQNNQSKKIGFEFDYAEFSYDSVSNYVEFYYSFDPSTMPVYKTDSSEQISGILKILFQDTVSHKIIFDKSWKLDNKVSTQDTVSKYLVGVLGFIIPHGIYSCKISGSDSNDSSTANVYNEIINVRKFDTEKLTLSDIELSSKILQENQNKKSIFYKNHYEVTPIPNVLFGETQPALFYYCELYNLDKTTQGQPLKYISSVYNSKGKLVYEKARNIKHNMSSRVEVGAIPVNKYPTDAYVLIISLIDSSANYGISSSKKFFIYNPTVVNTDTLNQLTSKSLSSEFGVMSEEELDDLFAKSRYIATRAEIDQYGKLTTAEGKRDFMYNFWTSRDQTPSTPKNEYYEEYLKRIKIADQKYGAINRKGWKTDRGRIYLKYGEPSEVDRYPNQTNTKPYEIWKYNDLEGGIEFVFGDLTGFNDYVLLHSTARGEIRDDNWMNRIQQL